MKKTGLLAVIFLIILAVGGFFAGSLFLPQATQTISSSLATPTPTVSPTPIPIPYPVTLSIPTISVNAAIESVGLAPDGRMDVPKKAQNVAWYNLGVKPGEKGNAVMAGHLDTISGAPAVFFKLKTLQIGDTITVTGENGNTFNYKVTRVTTYEDAQFPLQEVFGPTDKYRLNLITCSGSFDGAVNNYSHRTVVYSELIE